MKLLAKITAVLTLTSALTFTACAPGGDDEEAYTEDGVSFKMVLVPGGLTFPTGLKDGGTATVADAFWIAETEVTYEMWNKVYAWATDYTIDHNGDGTTGEDVYTFANVGRQGGGDNVPLDPVGTNQHPVTTINWRDSMVWCNALTEWYNEQNETSYECVYTSSGAIIRDSRETNKTACDGAFVRSTAKGFRLLTTHEWELAARWRNDATNTVSGYTNPYFTTGNSASGATTYYNDTAGDTGQPGNTANDAVAVYKFYHNDSPVTSTGVTTTAAVKSKTNGYNALGLYDMSGNVAEWCFDLYIDYGGSYRITRGGAWCGSVDTLQVGARDIRYPYSTFSFLGFRFARSAD